jgi:hypothetical protein
MELNLSNREVFWGGVGLLGLIILTSGSKKGRRKRKRLRDAFVTALNTELKTATEKKPLP